MFTAGWPVFSSPSYTTLMRRWSVCFPCNPRERGEILMVLASADLPDFMLEGLCVERSGLTRVLLGTLMEKVRSLNDVECDEKVFLHSQFPLQHPLSQRVLPLHGTLYIPPCSCWTPKSLEQVWATRWCAERKVRVGAVRDEIDLPLDVWSWFLFSNNRHDLLTFLFIQGSRSCSDFFVFFFVTSNA
jgi:hypothetical protein